MRADCCACGLNGRAQEPHAICDGPAVFIAAFVKQWRQKLAEQKAVCSMDLHATEPSLLRQLSCSCKFQRHLVDFVLRHRLTPKVGQVKCTWAFGVADWRICKRPCMPELQP